jgi:hypothetical protein
MVQYEIGAQGTITARRGELLGASAPAALGRAHCDRKAGAPPGATSRCLRDRAGYDPAGTYCWNTTRSPWPGGGAGGAVLVQV